MMQRRKREGKTDYRARLGMLKSGSLRLVARISLRNIMLQIIKYESEGDVTLVAVHSNELKKFGWNYGKTNISTAYLLGMLAATKAKKAKISEAIFDCGLRKAMKRGVLFAILKGAIDGGLNIPHNEEAFPSDERIRGEHIEKYTKSLDKESFKKRFSGYEKTGIKPEDIKRQFEAVKEKIIRG